MSYVFTLLANAVITTFMRLQVEVIVLLPEGGYARGAGRSVFANQSWSFWTDLLLGGCFGEASVALGGSECTHRAASDSVRRCTTQQGEDKEGGLSIVRGVLRDYFFVLC